MPSEEQQQWHQLSETDQQTTLEILNDERFGIPEEADSLEEQWDELAVNEDIDDATDPGAVPSFDLSSYSKTAGASTMATARTYDRTTSYTQRWTILGVTYLEMRTTIGYTTRSGNVLGVNRCYGFYVNYVPFRTIAHTSWHSKTSTTATCKTEWTLARPFQATVTGIQGLKVNGSGKTVQTWRVP